jgi:uncharacterized protein (TIGR02147 family)
MSSLFETEDYRKIIRNWVQAKPQKGRGELLKMAEFLGIPASVYSQTLSGQRELSADHAYLLAEYMGLLTLEKEYFVTLVQIEKATHHKFKNFLKEKKQQLKKESLNLSKRMSHEKTLNEKEQLEFYSSWLYSAIRLKCDIGAGLTAEEIKKQFNLSQDRLLKILEFLVSAGLIVQEKQHYKMGPQRTFVSRTSPMVARHHSNWRIKAIERSSNLDDKELMFTSPLTCSRKDAEHIREKMANFIQEVAEIVKDSPSEELVYLGMDLLKFSEES